MDYSAMEIGSDSSLTTTRVLDTFFIIKLPEKEGTFIMGDARTQCTREPFLSQFQLSQGLHHHRMVNRSSYAIAYVGSDDFLGMWGP